MKRALTAFLEDVALLVASAMITTMLLGAAAARADVVTALPSTCEYGDTIVVEGTPPEHWACTATNTWTQVGGAGGGSGTVTSVDLTAPADFGVSGNPVTTSGTIALTWALTQASKFLAGPLVGNPDAAPSFRYIAAGDLPTTVPLTTQNNTFSTGTTQTFDSIVVNSCTGCGSGGGGCETPPDHTTMTWINQGTATVRSDNDALQLTAPAAATSYIHMITETVTSGGDFTIVGKFSLQAHNSNYGFAGLALYNSANTRSQLFGTTQAGALSMNQYTGTGTFNAALAASYSPVPANLVDGMYWRARRVGTNLYLEVTADRNGEWELINTSLMSSWLLDVTHVGYFASSSNSRDTTITVWDHYVNNGNGNADPGDCTSSGGGGGGAGVTSFETRTGAVVSAAGDYTGTEITNTPAGNVAATTVQAAINELDSEKAPLSSPAFTDNPTAPTAASTDNDTSIATTAFVKTALAGGGTGDWLRFTASWDPAAITAGGTVATDITIGATGVDAGDPCFAGLTTISDNPDLQVTCNTGTTTVNVQIRNVGSSTIDPNMGQLQIVVARF